MVSSRPERSPDGRVGSAFSPYRDLRSAVKGQNTRTHALRLRLVSIQARKPLALLDQRSAQRETISTHVIKEMDERINALVPCGQVQMFVR